MSNSTDNPDVQKILNLPQQLASFIEDHLKWLQDELGNGVVLNAYLADLGLPPRQPDQALPALPDSTKGHLDSIENYRNAADPDVEALRSVLDDIFAVIDSVSNVIAAISDDSDDVKKELAAALLNLLLLNYLRLRYNWLYKIGQLFAFLTYPFWDKTGPALTRFFKSLMYDPLIRDHRVSADQDSDFDFARKLETEDDAKFWSDIWFTVLAGVLAWQGNKEQEGKSKFPPDFLATKNLIYGWDGLDTSTTPVADRLSRRTLTISFEYTKKDETIDAASRLTEALNLTVLLVPRSDGGPGIFVTLGGAEETEAPISEKWRLKLKASANGTLDFLIPLSGRTNFLVSGSTDARVSLRIQSETDKAEHSYVIPKKMGTRLELGKISFTSEINASGASFKASAEDSALVISSEDCDGFTAKSLPAQETRIGIGLGIGISSEKGFFIEGGSGLQAVIPIGKTVGPVNIQQLLIKLAPTTDPKPAKIAAEFSSSFNVKLGPITATIDQIGFQTVLPFARVNGKYDFSIGFKPPLGVGLSINASGVTGGGFLRFDPEKGQYDGIVELTLEDRFAVKGIGLIATRLPDSTKGFSLLIIITAEDLDIQLGLGFKLTAIGGLLAINRTFDETALRAGLKNHILDSILFPKDPIRNAPQILSNLNTVFPPAPGHHLFGPAARIEWGTPTLITADIALVLELGARLRLLALAHIAAILPKPENDLIRLQMAAIGLIDFDQGTAALDATLHDSRLVKKFTLTGDMALRLNWEGQRNFALAVGGLHPAFNPPSNFPKLERITLNLTTGDNPRFRCEAYFALTANTVQFGARAELFAAAVGFSIQGEVGFDVLIQVSPFQFLAEFFAQVQVKRGATNLLKVRVEGALAGPLPLHIKAKATFEVLWWDISVRIDKTLLEGVKPALAAGVNVLAQLLEALGQPGNWVGELPDGQRPMVTLRARSGAANEAPLHPLGTLKVKQNLVPLEMEIAQFGQTTPDGDRYFAIKNISIGGQEQKPQYVRDFFAPAQFFAMSDADKLSHPSFEQMAAGVAIGAHAISFKISDCLQVDAIEFETKIYDKATNAFRSGDLAESANPKQTKQRYTLPGDRLLQQAQFGAAANSDLRRTGKTKYQTTVGKYQVVKEGWSIVATDDLTVHPAPGAPEARAMSYSEAEQALTKLKQQDPVSAARLQILRFQSEVQAVA